MFRKNIFMLLVALVQQSEKIGVALAQHNSAGHVWGRQSFSILSQGIIYICGKGCLFITTIGQYWSSSKNVVDSCQ
jgi:hypothetical protein